MGWCTVASMETGLVITMAAFYGAATGSFLGVLLERLPKRQSIGGRSNCICGRQLTWWENVPIVSYLALRGVSRCCATTIPRWYLQIELATAAWFATCAALPLPPVLKVGIGAAVTVTAAATSVRRQKRQR